jgi:hypothetical protein
MSRAVDAVLFVVFPSLVAVVVVVMLLVLSVVVGLCD